MYYIHEKILIGMVGAGYAAHLRARAISELKNDRLSIIGVFDNSSKNACEFSKEMGVKLYSSVEEICNDTCINTVSIAVPNRFHYELVKYALESGKNVICEYPLVIDSYKKGEELVVMAARRGRFLHVGQTMNYDPDLKLVDSHRDELGKLYMGYKYMSFGGKIGSWFELEGFRGNYEGLAEWYIRDNNKGGWIVSAHYHGIQHFRKIFGEVVLVSAFDSTQEGIAAATVLLWHEHGASSSIQWAMPIKGKWYRTLIVSGSRGSIEVDGDGYSIHIGEKSKRGKLKAINTFAEDFKTLLDEIDGRRDLSENNLDMLMNLKIALLAEESAMRKRTVKVS
ncbi:MAG: Gfo/Idh/MocA family protein [Thermodesulfovibrionales bacterium]